jgi:hypothetical protein
MASIMSPKVEINDKGTFILRDRLNNRGFNQSFSYQARTWKI